MLPPVRCFSCGKVLPQNTYAEYQKWVKDRESNDVPPPWEVLGLSRRCCQANIMGFTDESDALLAYGDYKSSAYTTAKHTNVGTCVYVCR